MNNEFAARFQISENVSLMLNFSVIHHFGKLTVNACFFAVVEKVRGQTETDIEVQKDQLLTVDRQRVENRIGVEEIHKW